MHCKDFNLYEKLIEHKASVAVLGLGYVGFPLAIEFAKRFRTIGYDISSERIEELRGTFEEAIDITFTSNVADISDASLYVISVPTPVDENKNPDLNQLLESSAVVGKCLSPGNFVVYESTVYPGCTEDKCIPVLEKVSGLVCGDDFKVGYTPERINPNDAKHTLTNTVKIVSACDDEALDCIANIYNNIVDAGVELVSCIKVAEASKVLENTQRNVNIALMNEMAMLFSAMDIDMTEVLKAASTKWNFVNYSPGLVGGHCIPVAPWFSFKFNQVYDKTAHYNSYRDKAVEIINAIMRNEPIEMDRKATDISGNLDADKIRQICSDHGITYTVDSACRGGVALEDVKNKRNQLAHGTTSFAECGRYYAIDDLEKIKNETVIFLNGILQGMKKYYDEKTYLKVVNN